MNVWICNSDGDGGYGVFTRFGNAVAVGLTSRQAQLICDAHMAGECNHQWTSYLTVTSGNKPKLEIEACVRCGVERRKQLGEQEKFSCALCHRGMESGVTLLRVSKLGGKAIWICTEDFNYDDWKPAR